jgi:RNA polymerase sigma-70 factor, ECF subfamily
VPLSEVADDAPAVQESWDRNWHDQLMRRALVILRDRFGGSEQTFEAFRLYVLQNQPPADVAQHLGMSVDSVYKAKQRILKSLRDTIQQLDEED